MKVRLKQIAQDGAASGEVLGWNGTAWVPVAASGGGGSSSIVGGGSALRTGYASPGTGGDATFTVNGALGATKTTGEHLLQNNWTGNNTLAVQNTNTSNSFSAIRFLNPTGAERSAVGYGNPDAGNAAYPFQDATYLESSVIVNADGTTTFGTPPPIRFVLTGTIGGVSFQQRRGEFSSDGSFNLYTVAATTMANQKQTFRVTAAGLTGIGDGSAVTGSAGAAGPTNDLDVYGELSVGSATTPATNRAADGVFPINVFSPTADGRLLRLIRDNVGKVDLTYKNDGTASRKRLSFIDTDNSSAVPLSMTLDGTRNVAVAGDPGATNEFGGGVGMFLLINAGTQPASNPPNGGLLYVWGGALKYRGSSGTVTTLANA